MSEMQDTAWAGVDDARVGWALSLFEHPYGDDASVRRWDGVVSKAYQEAAEAGTPEWTDRDDAQGLRGRIEQGAAREYIDATAVREFLEAMDWQGSGQESLIERMLGYSSRLPELYWDLRRFRWLDVEQSGRLEQVFGGDWRIVLAGRLAAEWGEGWEQNPDEYKSAWLDPLLEAWESPGTDPDGTAVEPADDLDWLTAEQRSAVAARLGSAWETHLPKVLEAAWGVDWRGHPAEHRTVWLDPLLQQVEAFQQARREARERAIRALTDRALARRPDLADIPEERRRALAGAALDARR